VRTPSSTYRVQVTADFDLRATAALLPYLHDLGVGWVYLSPVLQAEPGSSHGYDVVDPGRVDDSRGGPEGLAAVSAEARRLGMSVLVDIVPNHVGVATPRANAWWWDVLTNGEASPYAPYFDIDWAAGDGKVLVPVLGDDGDLAPHRDAYPPAEGSHYRLISWREGDSRLNYRRFFTVATLAGVRVEDPLVFADAHREVRRWFDEDLVDGLRIDHPDGLRDPQGYLDDLARLTGGAYVVVEKILEGDEGLPRDWATDGTTGYDALALVDRVLTDPAGQAPLDVLETSLRGSAVDWAPFVRDSKRVVADTSLRAEVNRIVREVLPRGGSEAPALEDAVAELLACFPVYRSYLPEGAEHLDQAFAAARLHRPDLDAAFDRLAPVLDDPGTQAALRFQQTSGMVMAKGVEDSAFYRWSRLTSLTEVGADPAHFSVDPAGFHAAMGVRQRDWPAAMTTLSTHDTKRSEDVRARIAVLAEVPGLWRDAVTRLQALAPVPDPGFGNLLWQAALGAWPLGRERLHAYAEKAMREAGDRTTWTAPDEGYEGAVHAAVDAAYDEPAVTAVLDGLLAVVQGPGRSNALAAKLLALTMPGVPDVYQGTELWDLSLVDPDNRRPVDYDARRRALAGADVEGAEKLRLVHQALTLRRDRPELFTTYVPVRAEGPAADHVLAFDRGGAVTVVTRLPVGLAARGGWGDTVLLLDRPRPVAEVLATFPAALLVTA
jgi:(1->4)-alpha-D-glucan 1-alpha-D-glucosylmutase